MSLTPNSASTPYCNAIQALECYSQAIWGDMLKKFPDSPRPSYLAMIDIANPAGERLYFHMGIGAGEIESACCVRQRYYPNDLAALTGVSRLLLDKLNIARAMWSLYQFLKPGSARPQDVPFAKESEELLNELRRGEKIFSFLETEQAGTPSLITPMPNRLLVPNVVARANRLFPWYGINAGGIGRNG